jgi:dethiobiotin synthetase
MLSFFITATDTDAGKTLISSLLLHTAKLNKLSTLAFKPIASGIKEYEGQKINGDVELLKSTSTINIPYSAINPYLFSPAIAPHIAAKLVNKKIDLNLIYKQIKTYSAQADFCIVEGVGGWEVPLNSSEGIPDLAEKLNFPIIIIVKIKTGCINHAILTINAIAQKGLKIAGWVANQVIDDIITEENISTIEERTGVLCLAKIPIYELKTFKQQVKWFQSQQSKEEIKDLFFKLSTLE